MLEFLFLFVVVLLSCLFAFVPKGSWDDTPSKQIIPTPSWRKGKPIIMRGWDIPEEGFLVIKESFIKQYRERDKGF